MQTIHFVTNLLSDTATLSGFEKTKTMIPLPTEEMDGIIENNLIKCTKLQRENGNNSYFKKTHKMKFLMKFSITYLMESFTRLEIILLRLSQKVLSIMLTRKIFAPLMTSLSI